MSGKRQTEDPLDPAQQIGVAGPFLEALTELLPVCLFAKDLEGRYVYVNDAFVATTQKADRESIIGRKPSEVLLPGHAKLAEEEDRMILETGEPILNRENLNYKWHQSENYVIVSKICVRDREGRKLGIAGITVDITERKLDENRLAELNRELERRNKRYEEELALGREVQKAFVRVERPSAGGKLGLGHHYQPSEKLSGDLLVAEPIAPNRWAILLCDVMGHGVRSALITGILRGFYDEHKSDGIDPATFVTQLNQHYTSVLKGLETTLFTTLVFGILDLEKGTFSATCAGHHDPIWFRSAERGFVVRPGRLLTENPALGLLDNFSYSGDTLRLTEGDFLMLFTDGLTEARSPKGEEFGNESIRRILGELQGKSEQTIVDAVVEEMKEFAEEIDDDISLLLLRYGTAAENAGS